MNLENLIKIIDARATADPSESWTAKLLSQGPETVSYTHLTLPTKRIV